MIVYFKCLCTAHDKILVKRLREQFNAEIRLTRGNRKYAKQAAKYNMKLPFMVENGQAKPL